MESIIQKWGNSLGIRIPKAMATELELNDGSHVELQYEGDKIVIYPMKKASLEEKLSKITKQNLHSEISTGNSIGKEAW
ncbi:MULTISPECIES: AbrB/MazE/SpoVT family DNA-binding domain-containing protein [Leptospira]|uniref:Antidote-toxin recognition MazE n=3 Tax=Leptospira TaxID=171 RepID=M6CIW7_9LEPT|nr:MULTISPECIES: AbrB/MazE/SpoVT family DNA-binding domain-containing protein [Leptospira]EMJ90566.1 antidote-toxin recognition MazE [Leptospira alstonii serovar Sichuan str. 79601]EMN88897.1 antidote-toxin recognition MazE [Leptospira weilii str. UI 13098]EQA82048.1 antidote-toxin recognition MazE [Leptospira alstonii serovar Pingchang str. 80-412]OMI14435.1 multidrug transporter MatE [Leptospira weilii serovar Heyan]ULH26796.1 AbrB/MazE/SpoVT family DNA-binding domain-containing protein [Lep